VAACAVYQHMRTASFYRVCMRVNAYGMHACECLRYGMWTVGLHVACLRVSVFACQCRRGVECEGRAGANGWWRVPDLILCQRLAACHASPSLFPPSPSLSLCFTLWFSGAPSV